jgi:murein DD-endopeptidase MepM/ murein hydrolase activator NlpD
VASNQPAYAPAPVRGATGTTDEPGTDGRGFQPFGPYEAAPQPGFVPGPQPEFAAVPQPEFAPAPGLAPQPEFAPAPQFAPAPVLAPAPGLVPEPQPEFAPAPQAESAPAAEPQQPRLPRQRNVARSGTVLGIAAMAAVGAAGVAAAAPVAPAAATGAVPVSAPDRAFEPEPLPPYAEVPTATRPAEEVRSAAQAVSAPDATEAAHEALAETPAVPLDPGEALRTRIIGQAVAQREAVAQAERDATAKAAAEQAAREAAAQKVRDQAAAAKAAAEARAKADAAAAARAEAERLEQLAASYIKPVASYTLTNAFGEADPWANLHTGQDFTAPTGTPVHAVHSGTVTSAGWAGAYGYRVVLTLDDGTQLWYCHLSTMVVTEGPVTTGETIGRVGATGNVPAPHLHLEVRPGGAAPVDPVPWLQSHDVAV